MWSLRETPRSIPNARAWNLCLWFGRFLIHDWSLHIFQSAPNYMVLGGYHRLLVMAESSKALTFDVTPCMKVWTSFLSTLFEEIAHFWQNFLMSAAEDILFFTLLLIPLPFNKLKFETIWRVDGFWYNIDFTTLIKLLDWFSIKAYSEIRARIIRNYLWMKVTHFQGILRYKYYH